MLSRGVALTTQPGSGLLVESAKIYDVHSFAHNITHDKTIKIAHQYIVICVFTLAEARVAIRKGYTTKSF